MYFIISIDTEEDNWDNFKDKPTLKNIQKIPALQELFDRYKVRPTYLITYPVACDKPSVEILKSILDSGKCEIGTHLHPWNTPPVQEVLNEKNRMLNNLSRELQFKKLKNLHYKIKEEFNCTPVSFRAGRYGLNNDLTKNLMKLDYRIESSTTPFLDWSFLDGPDFSDFYMLNPYRFSSHNFKEKSEKGELIEVPLSAGYLQKEFRLANTIFKKLKKRPIRYFKIIGILSLIGLLNRVRLTPEGYRISEMKKLIRAMMKNNVKFYNISFHSNTLFPGQTPFVSSNKELDLFLKKLEDIIKYMVEIGLKPITLSEVQHKRILTTGT